MSVAKVRFAVAFCLVACLSTAWLRALDPYETPNPSASVGDDNSGTDNAFIHGVVQHHDLEQVGVAEDQDWIAMPSIARHSYDVRATGSVTWDWGACPGCTQIERVNSAGAILTEDVSVVDEGNPNQESYVRSVRWIAAANTNVEFIRVTGATGFTESADAIYQIVGYDTTFAVPRWNNAGGQVTVFLITNMVDAAVTGNIYFYTAAGTLLATQPISLPKYGMATVNTATIGALAGQSGHAQVAHTAGYGGLAGKAVALEPATGFSFDTPLVPIPR